MASACILSRPLQGVPLESLQRSGQARSLLGPRPSRKPSPLRLRASEKSEVREGLDMVLISDQLGANGRVR